MTSDQPTTRSRSRVGARRRGRELGLALLYAADVRHNRPSDIMQQAGVILNMLLEHWAMSRQEIVKLVAEVEAFGRRLAEAYFQYAEIIDTTISRQAEGWRIERMPLVDRNILRLALAEMWYVPDVPVGPTIDEAVELAKEYATPESGKFINGILGAVARQEASEVPGGRGDC